MSADPSPCPIRIHNKATITARALCREAVRKAATDAARATRDDSDLVSDVLDCAVEHLWSQCLSCRDAEYPQNHAGENLAHFVGTEPAFSPVPAMDPTHHPRYRQCGKA